MRLIIISNRLPVTACLENERYSFTRSAGGLASGLNSYLQSQDEEKPFSECLWLGWPGIFVDPLSEQLLREQLLREYNCYPVFLQQENIDGFYNGFCNNTLWPLFHCFTSKAQFETWYWDQYQDINKLFADVLKDILREDDVVWIHDYHLMLLPQMVRDNSLCASIGFFLHIPFPSFEIFRVLKKEWAIKLLTGVLGADVIGMHTVDYAEHFKDCLLKILKLKCSNNGLRYNGRQCLVDSFPMGIDFGYFSQMAQSPPVAEMRERIRRRFYAKKLVLSIDRLDYTKGIINRLLAFELFLEMYPEWHDGITLVLAVVPSRWEVEMYQMMKVDIDRLVGKINGRFSTTDWLPVSYQYKQFSPEELAALYTSCEVALITPLRDGMNLISKEYIASQVVSSGVLILSEMAGSSHELLEAEMVNPCHIEEISSALAQAVICNLDEQAEKNLLMQQRIKSYDVIKWAADFLGKVVDVRMENRTLLAKIPLNGEYDMILRRFSANADKLLILDYDGTLAPFEKFPELAKPGSRVLDVLRRLSEIPDLCVVIISGRDKLFLEEWFGGLQIDLAAENGHAVKKNNKWIGDDPDNDDWKYLAKEILSGFVRKLPGSFIEEKEHSLVWHYRNSDSRLSELRTSEFTDKLRELAFDGRSIKISQGVKSVEVSGREMKKHVVVRNWLRDRYGFVCCIGDDDNDEELFRVLPEGSISIKVGIDRTHADYIFPDTSRVIDFLEQLAMRQTKTITLKVLDR